MRTDEELRKIALCNPARSCGTADDCVRIGRRAVYDLGRADERARLAGDGPSDEALQTAFERAMPKSDSRWKHMTYAEGYALRIRAVADLAAAHAVARYKAQIAEREAADLHDPGPVG